LAGRPISGAGWFFDGYVINVWPLAIPFLMTDLHLTVKDIGTITTLYVTAYMLGTLLGGTFADYLGRRSVLSFSVLFYMFVDALTAVAQGFWSLGFFRFMTGTGTGMELPVGSTFITEAVDSRWRARLLSVMGIGYPGGYVLAIGAFATIGAVWGWRAVEPLNWTVLPLTMPTPTNIPLPLEVTRSPSTVPLRFVA
jgi:putative MFS transporter